MKYERCTICDHFGFTDTHRCPPLWECAIEEPGEPYWQEVCARDRETAAEKFAESYDNDGDYTIIQAGDGGDTVVLVREPEKPDTVKRLHVWGEMVAHYNAEELTQETAPR